MRHIVEIEKLDHQGRGISKINGKVIFIPNAYIGETVEVEVIKETKKYMEGKVTKYIKTSNNRINYNCPYYHECGGCNIAHINYEKQLEFKKNTVIDIFKRYANIDINPNICESEDKFHYRNKVVFHIENNKMGFYKDETNLLVPIDSCLLLNQKLNDVIETLTKKLDISELKEILLRTNGEEVLVKITSVNKLLNTNMVFKDKEDKSGEKATRYLKENSIVFNLGDYKYAVTSDSFFQVNTKQAIRLYDKVREYVGFKKIETALDLYCGTGAIAIYISDLCNRVIGVEVNKSSITCANYNKLLNKIDNIEFIEGDVSTVINNEMNPDLIVVDPPRSGLDNKTISIIKQIKPKKLIYVSCNPMTLARDIQKLSEEYEFNDIELFDMFPNTYHVECISLLYLRNNYRR